MRNQSLLVKKLTALAMALMFLVASSGVTRVEAAPATPGLTPQQIERVIEEVFAALVVFDVPKITNHFADDAVVEDPVGTPPIVGKQAIAAYLETFPTLFSQMKLYSLDVKVGGQHTQSFEDYSCSRRCLQFLSCLAAWSTANTTTASPRTIKKTR